MFQSSGGELILETGERREETVERDDKSEGEDGAGQLNLYQYFTLIRGTRPRYQLRLYLLCGWISLLAVTLMGKALSKQWGWEPQYLVTALLMTH